VKITIKLSNSLLEGIQNYGEGIFQFAVVYSQLIYIVGALSCFSRAGLQLIYFPHSKFK
jgi:hypothetical protein